MFVCSLLACIGFAGTAKVIVLEKIFRPAVAKHPIGGVYHIFSKLFLVLDGSLLRKTKKTTTKGKLGKKSRCATKTF